MSLKNKKNPVQPTLVHVGDTKEHALKVLLDGPKEDMPILTSVGYVKIPETKLFSAYIIRSQGHEILSVEVDEPDHQAVAEESAKISFANEFITRGFEG